MWEGTDNQMGSSDLDLTVFAGGPHAERIQRNLQQEFNSGMRSLFGDWGHNLVDGPHLVNWPREPYILGGYSIPGRGQVTGALRLMNTGAIGGRVFVAGEHASPGFFGYMEGALQTGFVAAVRIAYAANIRYSMFANLHV